MKIVLLLHSSICSNLDMLRIVFLFSIFIIWRELLSFLKFGQSYFFHLVGHLLVFLWLKFNLEHNYNRWRFIFISYRSLILIKHLNFKRLVTVFSSNMNTPYNSVTVLDFHLNFHGNFHFWINLFWEILIESRLKLILHVKRWFSDDKMLNAVPFSIILNIPLCLHRLWSYCLFHFKIN